MAPGSLGSGQHGAEALPERSLQIGLGLELAAPDLILERLVSSTVAGTPKSASIKHPLHVLEIVGVESAHERAHVGQARSA